jgi:hypothetical protein
MRKDFMIERDGACRMLPCKADTLGCMLGEFPYMWHI